MPAVGAEPTRVLVSRGVMVASVALYAAVALDGDVVVFAIDLDRWPRSERRRSRRGVDDHVWARAVR